MIVNSKKEIFYWGVKDVLQALFVLRIDTKRIELKLYCCPLLSFYFLFCSDLKFLRAPKDTAMQIVALLKARFPLGDGLCRSALASYRLLKGCGLTSAAHHEMEEIIEGW